LDVILAALPPSLRAALEHYMEGHVYQSDFARRYYSQGLEEGREQGLEEGNARGLRKAVLELMHAKLDVVTAEEQASIDAIGNERVLTELIGELARTAGATEARAALAAARHTR
jgi:flagellar biosynthesis/type III secretory pathway protein FliH